MGVVRYSSRCVPNVSRAEPSQHCFWDYSQSGVVATAMLLRQQRRGYNREQALSSCAELGQGSAAPGRASTPNGMDAVCGWQGR